MDSEYVCSELKTIISVPYIKLCPMIFLIKRSIIKKTLKKSIIIL